MNNHIPDFTIVVAVDANRVGQFREVWPTWVKNHPDVLTRRLVVIFDRAPTQNTYEMLTWLNHPSCTVIPWTWRPDLPQRERMLTAFVRAPELLDIHTPYWCKIDADVVATASKPWVQPEWFDGNPALVGSPWGYTKPGAWLPILEAWGDAALPSKPRLGLQPPPDCLRFGHPRICSWICFVRTDWSLWASHLAGPDRLPVPSQDTYHWYVAARNGDLVRKVKFKKFGWTTLSNWRKRRAAVAEAMK